MAEITQYVANHEDGWKNSPDKTTPIDAESLDHIERGIELATTETETALQAVTASLASLTTSILALEQEDADLLEQLATVGGEVFSLSEALTDLETRLAALEGA